MPTNGTRAATTLRYVRYTITPGAEVLCDLHHTHSLDEPNYPECLSSAGFEKKNYNYSEWTKGSFSEVVTVTDRGKMIFLAGVGAEDESAPRGAPGLVPPSEPGRNKSFWLTISHGTAGWSS